VRGRGDRTRLPCPRTRLPRPRTRLPRPCTRSPRPLHAVHAGGGTVHAGGGTVHAGGGTVHACGNRVITRSLRGCRGRRFEIENCKSFLHHIISSLRRKTKEWRERWEVGGIRERKVRKEQKSAFQSKLVARLAANSSHDSSLTRRTARLFQDCGAGLSPCAGTPLLKRPVGTRGAASMQDTRCPKEPHAQRSWHLQRSLPAQSEDLRTKVWSAESLRRRAARPTPRSMLFTSCMIVGLGR